MSILETAFNERNKKQNKIEKVKELKDAFSTWDKLEYYAKNGFDSIPDEDKSYFLKCFGIYYREKTPKQFMLKLRIPGGHLTSNQTKIIGECAKEFGQDYIDYDGSMAKWVAQPDNYKKMFAQEIIDRKTFKYPPFVF